MPRIRKPHTSTLHTLPIILAVLLGMWACTIEPPLKLASRHYAQMTLGEIITDIDVIWDDSTWRDQWWYGWDEADIQRWGEIEYPEPSNYEARFLHHGELPGVDTYIDLQRQTMYERTFRRSFEYGYHTLLAWTNIDSPDGTQVLKIDESDIDNVFATTSRTSLSYTTPSMRAPEVLHNPEIFYGTRLPHFHISRDTTDYDYFDPKINAWVKTYHTGFTPLVYIYLVQVVIYNNNGRITGSPDDASISAMANGVTVNTGHTSNTPVNVSYEIRMKKDIPARNGRRADIIGGKFNSFGLCDMDGWHPSRGPQYAGSRTDLSNYLSLKLAFSNQRDSAYHFEITDQLRRQAHGGVVTIEIDADTLHFPTTPPSSGGPAAGFDPWVVPCDSVTYEFGM